MGLTIIDIKDTMEQVKLNKSPYSKAQESSNSSNHFENYKAYMENKSIFDKFNIISNTIGHDFNKNSIFTTLIELTKYIPFVNANYHLLLLGEAALGKSSPYSIVLNTFSNITSGIPTEAALRGAEKKSSKTSDDSREEEIDYLLGHSLLLFEEIADISNKSNSLPLLKIFLEDKIFNKYNKVSITSNCSIVTTANNYAVINSYQDIKSNNIFSDLPSLDKAFFSRFGGALPHYNNIFGKKVYASSGDAIHCIEFGESLLKMRELDTKEYFSGDEHIINERVIRNVNNTINGFVKIFYVDSTPDQWFVDFITEWALFINSISNQNEKIHNPFNHKSISFLAKVLFRGQELKYATFLSDHRVLFKFKNEENNSSILALNGLGVKENENDLEFLKELDSNLKDLTIPLTKRNDYILDLHLVGEIGTSRKYNSEGHLLLENSTDNEYNELLIQNIELSAISMRSFDINKKFRGIPKFYEGIIHKDAEKLVGTLITEPLRKTCYIVNGHDIKFFNYSELLNK